MPNLFREEALVHQADSIFGNVIVSSGRASTVMACIAMFLSAGLLALLIAGTYVRKERVIGYLSPSAGLAQVYAPRVGAIARMDVDEGDMVQEGEELFSVVSPRDSGSGLDVDQAHMDRLQQERASLESQVSSEEALADERIGSTKRRISEIGKQLLTAHQQHANALARLALAERSVGRLEALQKARLIAAALVDVERARALEALQDVQAFEREINGLEAELDSLQSVLNQIPLQLSVRKGELHSRLHALDGELAEVEVHRAVVVRARVSGRVSGLIAHTGMAVTPERQVLSIIPDGSRLQAELLVPTRAAGFLREGQAVRLRYDAFPYQKFGLYRAKISSISRTVLNPEDQIGPARLSIPAYRVVAELHSQSVTAYGEFLQLQPGLTLQADLMRDRRRIIEWIFDPIFAAVRGI